MKPSIVLHTENSQHWWWFKHHPKRKNKREIVWLSFCWIPKLTNGLMVDKVLDIEKRG